MAVISVKELFEGRSGGDNLERKRTYVRVFESITDDVDDDAYVAGAGAGIPRNGEPHPSDTYAVMVDIDCVQSSADPKIWLVTCRYSSDFDSGQQREALGYDSSGLPYQQPGSTSGTGGGQATREPDPRDRPPVFEVDWEATTEVIRKDVNGGDVKNSAGDPFDPPLTVERSEPVITITKNVDITSPILDIEKQAEWQEGVNSDTPWGYDIHTLRITRIRYSSAVENDIAYATVTLSIKVRWNTWIIDIVDAGYRDIDDNWFTEPDTKAQTSEPRPLDGAGQALPQGDPLHYISVAVYRPIEFAPILGYLGVST